MNALSFADVERVVAEVPEWRRVVLVGGQALNYWADHFGITEYGAALSADIDFLGGADAAAAFAAATGGRLQLAGLENAHSPNTALVTVDLDGQSHTVDFLGNLLGFSQQELNKVHAWSVAVRPRGRSGPALAVMHPVHCLQSQLSNVYGRALDRRSVPGGERNAQRVRLAVEACRRTVVEHLRADRERDSFVLVEKVHALSLSGESLRARFEDGLQVEAAIPVERLPAAFQKKRWPQMERERAVALGKYERLLARRAAVAKKKR